MEETDFGDLLNNFHWCYMILVYDIIYPYVI